MENILGGSLGPTGPAESFPEALVCGHVVSCVAMCCACAAIACYLMLLWGDVSLSCGWVFGTCGDYEAILSLQVVVNS